MLADVKHLNFSENNWLPGTDQMDSWLEITILYIFTCGFHCLSFCLGREGNRMRPLVLFMFAWVLYFLSWLIHVAGWMCIYICIGCMCTLLLETHRLATGWTWGHRAHLFSISLTDTATPYAVVARLLIQPLQQQCLRSSGINYEPEVIKHHGWLQK